MCLLRTKCCVMHQGYSTKQESWNFNGASSLRDPDHTTTKTVNPIASPLLTTALLQWFWMRPSSLGCVDEWEKMVAINLYKLHESWPTNLPVFYPQTIQNYLVVLHSVGWDGWLGVLHFLNRKFKLVIRLIDLTLTMGRLCLFKLICRSLNWGIAFSPSADQASRVISHTYNDSCKENRK